MRVLIPWMPDIFANLSNDLISLFPVNYRKAQGLMFWGEGEGCGLALSMFLLRGPS